jgi:hypothetical protein
MVTDAVRQGVATVLSAAQLLIGTVMNLGVAEQGFLPRSTDGDIAYLIESFEPAANTILPEVDMDEILHANLDP